jgi:hypothetical protein
LPEPMPAKRSLLRRLLAGYLRHAWMGWPSMAAGLMTPVAGLHECPLCRRDRVSPITIAESGQAHWDVRLRCGECGDVRDLRITNAQAADYDEALNRHTAVMRRELARLESECMAAEVDAFVQALSFDLIEASDFAR